MKVIISIPIHYKKKKKSYFSPNHTLESAGIYLHDFDYEFRHLCALLTKFSPNFTSCINDIKQIESVSVKAFYQYTLKTEMPVAVIYIMASSLPPTFYIVYSHLLTSWYFSNWITTFPGILVLFYSIGLILEWVFW